MSNIRIGKVIEKVMGKIKKEEEPAKEVPADITPAPTPAAPSRATGIPEKVYLRALAIHSLEELDKIRDEVRSGNILIIRVRPLAEKDIDDVKRAVSELYKFAQETGGDIARLGEERVVLTPSFVKIWRETPAESEG